MRLALASTRLGFEPGESASWAPRRGRLAAHLGCAVALSAAEQTEGLVNPLLGRPLVQLGYDQDFHRLQNIDCLAPGLSPLPLAPPLDAWRRIEIEAAGALRIPAGTALDLGAVGKAWAADVIANAFRRHLTAGAIVSVGGARS